MDGGRLSLAIATPAEGGRDNLRQVLIALGALMAGANVNSALVLLPDRLPMNWRQDPGRDGPVPLRPVQRDTALC